MSNTCLTPARLAVLAMLLTANATPLLAARNPIDLPLDPALPPRVSVTALAGHPLAAAIFEEVAIGEQLLNTKFDKQLNVVK